MNWVRRLETLPAAHRTRSNSSRAKRGSSRRMLILLLAWLAFVSCAPSATGAQVAEGSISGTVRGESGAAMPGVQVSVTDLSSNAVRTVITGTDGFYDAPGLPPGNYEMSISAPGFVTQVLTAINVAAGAERALNVVMRAGNPKQVLRAPAPPAQVSSASSTVGGNVNASTVRDTPL